jgi:hypothetical protein
MPREVPKKVNFYQTGLERSGGNARKATKTHPKKTFFWRNADANVP